MTRLPWSVTAPAATPSATGGGAGASPFLALLRLSLLLAGAAAAGAPTALAAQAVPGADPRDVATLDGIVRAFYEVVSGPAGGSADRARDRTLHLPEAVVGVPVEEPDGSRRIATMSLEAYHDRFGGPRAAGFWEREIHRLTHRFGRVAHVMSTYVASTTPDGEPLTRGVNSIQLLWDGTRWWIASWSYDEEGPATPIPPAFLPPAERAGEAPARVGDGADGPSAEEAPAPSAEELARQAAELHRQRRVGEAGRVYRALLEMEPPAPPTAEERGRALALAPLLHLHPDEPFLLEDVVAVLHPEEPVIAYHLFWDDDIDFPDDQEPTDHEIVWVEHDASGRPRAVVTYFHGQRVRRELAAEGPGARGVGDRSAPGAPAAEEALRPRVAVEWGKHGSLPLEWAGRSSAEAGAAGAGRADELRENWRRLHEEGTRRPDHPLARGWPTSFPGDWDAYRDFSVVSDPRRLLEERGMIIRSLRANAVLDQWFLPYNFSPKPEWP